MMPMLLPMKPTALVLARAVRNCATKSVGMQDSSRNIHPHLAAWLPSAYRVNSTPPCKSAPTHFLSISPKPCADSKLNN
jgi:hypothetical protein